MKSIALSILIAVVMIGGAIILSRDKSDFPEQVNNVEIIDGEQVVTISAKGGYLPRKSTAKAGIPTRIQFETSGTFDCSSVVRIARLDITQTLPQTGLTTIDIGSHEVGTLQGSCGMGMYPFEIEFGA